MAKLWEDVQTSLDIKKSRFLTYLIRIDSEEEAKEKLKQIKKEHPDANHHCSAMILDTLVRSNDDGEPAGTAGHPMLDVLMHANANHILAVVVRYFGGIKLGTGGLVRAYSQSVQQALDQATFCEEKELYEYEIQFSYDWIGKIDPYFHSHSIPLTLQEYGEHCLYHFLSPQDLSEDLKELSSGTIVPVYIQTIVEEVPILNESEES